MESLIKVEENNPYKRWINKESIPVISGYSVDDVMKIPLQPWQRTGASTISWSLD